MAAIDKLTAARACNRDAPNGKANAKQSCSDIVNISIFFDGTGNNKDVDKIEKKWSNPARLWQAAQLLFGQDVPNYTIYVSGVGTPFNGTATDWIDEKLMKLEDTATGGLAGGGGTRRTEHGQSMVNDSIRAALTRSATKLNISLKPYLQKGKPANLRGLAAALEGHGLITIINLSIFGFSRGAALARAFSNDMLKLCVTDNSGVARYEGAPIRFHFMGLFDTVASFGVPSLNVDMAFDEKNLVVPYEVERCVHYVAAQELRFSFPVDLIRRNGTLKTGWTETVYPGVHSDVGGGYEPVNQKISNNYARIPMRDMMREAALSGVRIVDYDDVVKIDVVLFKSWFEIKPETQEAYAHYMGAIGVCATVEHAINTHMKALYSAWGTMTRRKIKTPDLIEAEGKTGPKKDMGHPGIAREAELLLNHAKASTYYAGHIKPSLSPNILQVEGMKYRMIVRPEKWRLDAWQATAPDAVLNFVSSSVHDAKAGFIHSIEPFSYFRPRGMAESSRNVLARGLDWLDDSVSEIIQGAIKIYHKAEGVVVETWEEGKLVAIRTYKVGEKFAVDTARACAKYTVEVYQSGRQVLISSMKKGEQMIITSIDMARKEANALAEKTQKTAGELADAAHKKATEVGRQMQTNASSAARGAGQAVDSGLKAVEDSWRAAQSAFGY